MEGFGNFSARPYPDLWERPPPSRERAPSARLRGSGLRTQPAWGSWTGTLGEGSEVTESWSTPHCSWPRRRRSLANSSRESRSLRDVAQRPPDPARKHRARSRRLEDAWGEPRPQPLGGSRPRPAWPRQPQPCQCYTAAQGDLPPLYPEGAHTPLSGTRGAERRQSGDPWAVPVCRGLDCWSLSSVPTEKSPAPSQVFRTLSACVCAPKRGSSDRVASLTSQYLQRSVSSKEAHSQHTQVLKNKLEEAVVSPRDQKIVALVLTRLKKAQRMRELQQQVAAAWEELKRWDQKVQMTLERERKLLLQQSREQWLQKEQPKTRPNGEPRGGRKRASQARNAVQQGDPRQAPWGAPEAGEILERPGPEADPGKQRQAQPLPEPEKLQDQRERNGLALQRRLGQAGHEPQLHARRGPQPAQEANISSRVNHQARKVLKDCQTKAEELLRRLSLDQSFQHSREVQQGLVAERARELREKARKDGEHLQQVQWCAEHLAEQRKVHKRLLMELADQKVRQARSSVGKNIGDLAQHVCELHSLREKNHRILKLKAEKEEKGHVQGIKDALRMKQQQSLESISPEKEAPFAEFQRPSRAPGRDHGRASSFLDQMEPEAQLQASGQRGLY